MTCTLILFFLIPALVFVGALWHISCSRKAKVAERWGIIFAFFGILGAFLATVFLGTQYTSAQVAFTASYFVVISSVGANLLVSGVTAGLQR